MFVDQIGHLAHLHARDTSFALVAIATLAKIEALQEAHGVDSRQWRRDGLGLRTYDDESKAWKVDLLWQAGTHIMGPTLPVID